MATLTRLASTLTAKYFPSQTLTDAFYMDGRLMSKRETRQADITTDKEERGFFFSVFAHPRIAGYEPGSDVLPPYEKQLLDTLNEVKSGRRTIDDIIDKFMNTAVDVTGKMRLQDNEIRSPYFAGVIVRDSEAFAVTIGSGLAFLYRDDTLFPLTDAGIPMEPIDSNGNKVGDFLNYCSSKGATATWSNYFTVSPDDCIILCNKEIYDALGQKEILRILAEADDQCDAAGNIIYQASARMPNVPMQFSISFVESVTSDERKGLFGFRKKNKDIEEEEVEVHSTFDDGVIGAAAQAAADAGFTSGIGEIKQAEESTSDAIMFGDNQPGPVVPAANQVASEDKGFELFNVGTETPKPLNGLEFMDSSTKEEPVVEMSPEEMMANLFGGSAAATTATTAAAATAEAAAASTVTGTAASESPFVAAAFNPFDIPASSEPEMKPISTTAFEAPAEDENSKTKPVEKLDADFISSLQNSGAVKTGGITEAALKELNVEVKPVAPVVEETPAPVVPAQEPAPAPAVGESGELVFEASTAPEIKSFAAPSTEEAFNPYSVGNGEEMQSTAPFVFGDDLKAPAPEMPEEVHVEESNLEFDIKNEKPEIKEEDKLPVDFPEAAKIEQPAAPVVQAPVEEAPAEEAFKLPFENAVETIPEEKPVAPEVQNDIPDMPLFSGNTFDTPVVAVNSEQPVNIVEENVLTYGQYMDNENMAAAPEQPVYEQPVAPVVEPQTNVNYQPYGSEGGNYNEFVNNEQPGGYQYSTEAAYQPNPGEYVTQSASTATEDEGDTWINDLLGLGGVDTAPVSDNGGDMNMTSNTSAPRVGNPPPRKPVNRPASASASGARSGGNGGNGRGGRRVRKLNRNGYIFLAFVILLLVGFIIMISMIVKSCSKDEEPAETSETTPAITSELIESEATTTTASEETNNPSAPIGVFAFSDYIGYRTWWDLFNQVYGIQIENAQDSRIQVIRDYNGLDASYSPNSGDQLLLPPVGVIEGTIVNTFTVGSAQTAPAETGDIISGEVAVIGDDEVPAEAPAEGEAAEPAV